MVPDELHRDSEGSERPRPRPWGNYAANIEFLRRTRLLEDGPRVMEIGCGAGELLRYLIGRGITAIGIDLRPRCEPDLPVLVARGDQLPFSSGTFDLVLSFDVFEHIPDTEAHLNEVFRVLEAGGHYALQTPNILTNVPFEVLRAARRGGIRTIPAAFRPPEHCSLHSYWGLLRRFHQHNLAVTFVDVPVVNEFFTSKIEMYAGQLGAWALRIANPDRFPIPLRTNFYIVAQLAR